MNPYYCLLFATVSNAFANLLLKQSSLEKLSGFDGYFSIKFIFSIALFGINFLFYRAALKSIPINIGYPILIGIGSLIIFSFSFLLFNETLNIKQLLGAVLIILGILLMGT